MDLLLFPSYLIMLAVSAIGCFPHYQHMKKESKLFVLFSIVSKPESRLYKMFFFFLQVAVLQSSLEHHFLNANMPLRLFTKN